jgi:hypothetical protein
MRENSENGNGMGMGWGTIASKGPFSLNGRGKEEAEKAKGIKPPPPTNAHSSSSFLLHPPSSIGVG